MSHKYIPKINGYTHALRISPRFYNLRANDGRMEYSALGQVDTVYEFDTPHIRIKNFSNFWETHDLSARSADGQEYHIIPNDVFSPMATAFRPIIIYSRDRRFGTIRLTMQSPNQALPVPCEIAVPIIDPAQFSLLVSTGMTSYRLTYNWENRLCVY